MTQFLDTPVDKSLGATSAWTDIDISANVPTTATGAIFQVTNSSTGSDYEYGFRKNGSSDNRHRQIRKNAQYFAVIGIDANRKCEGYIASTNVDFFLVGYTEEDATFFTNSYDKSLSATSAWTDIDLSAELPAGSVAAIFEVESNAILNKDFGLRKNGSTDNRTPIIQGYEHNFFVVGVDANRKCEGYIASTNIDFFLVGYLSTGQAETNAVDKSLGSTGAYVDIDESGNAPAWASGIFGEVVSSAAYKYAVRKNGSNLDKYYDVDSHNAIFSGLDATKKWEGKIENAGVDFYRMGYFMPGAENKTKTSSVGLRVVSRKTKASSLGLRVVSRGTKASSLGLRVVSRKTKASSLGLSIWENKTKASSLGLRVVSRKTKASSLGLRVVSRKTKASSLGLSVWENKTKTSSLGLSVWENKTKTSSLGLSVWENKTKTSSLGLSVWENKTKASSLGLRVVSRKTKASSLGLRVVSRKTKASSLGLSVHGTNTKASSVGLSISIHGVKQNGPIFGADFDIIIASGTSSKTEIISDTPPDSNMFLSDLYFEIPGLSTPNKTARLKLLTARDNVVFDSGNKDASFSRSMRFSSARGLNDITKYEVTTDAPVTGDKTFGVEFRGFVLSEPATNTSSLGLSVWENKTKTSSLGLSVWENKTKTSSLGLRVVSRKTKASSLGLSVHGILTKASSLGLRVVSRKTKASSLGLRVVSRKTKASSLGLSVHGTNTKASSVGLSIWENKTKASSLGLSVIIPPLSKGLFYGKLGDTILETVKPESFRISEEINKIPSFEFEVANSEANRTAIAANVTELFEIYWQHHGADTHIFTGIINVDSIEYISLTNIRISGFASYAKLGWPLYKHLNSEDAEPVNTVLDYHGTYTNYTTAANNDTINDVLITFGNFNHALYIGENNIFWGAQIKYSTNGVPNANSTVVIEYSKGSSTWATLNVLDESDAFTNPIGTYDLIIPHPPSDWARNTVNGIKKFWIRYRLSSIAPYITAPQLDRIKITNVDIYRVFYLATSAREILLDVLDGTEYSMDATDACPEDEINLLAEYESPLRVIAAIPMALTWTDTDGSKKSYQWWIDESNKVHIKKRRGTTHSYDLTGDLTIFNNLVDYFNISNRLIGFSKRDGLSQIRAIVEDNASQTTHALREIAVPKNEIGKYSTLKESLEKDIAYSKDPMQRIKGSVTTEFWGKHGYEVGDTVTLQQGEWVVEEGGFQIVKADIGPILTQLNLGISQEHLEGLKSNLKRAFDINNVQMHGSTSLFTAGPETSNYERKDDGSVYSAKLKLEMPSDVIKTHKMLVSWTVGPYRASVNETTGDVPAHNHGGNALTGGAIGSGSTGGDGGFTPNTLADGGFTPNTLADGGFTPSMLSEAHTHDVPLSMCFTYLEHSRWFPDKTTVGASKVYGLNHNHSNPNTGSGGSHGHSAPSCGSPSGYAAFVQTLSTGSACTSGYCITGVNSDYAATRTHTHSIGSISSAGSHSHGIGNTGNTYPNAYIDIEQHDVISDIQSYEVEAGSDAESPAHLHTGIQELDHDHPGVYENDHDHPGVYENDHDHITDAVPAHCDHIISDELGSGVDIGYGIHEEPGGTVLELVVDGEIVGEYSGDQTEIRIDGYLSSGASTVEIQPITTELGKKGGATIWANGILFIEPKKF